MLLLLLTPWRLLASWETAVAADSTDHVEAVAGGIEYSGASFPQIDRLFRSLSELVDDRVDVLVDVDDLVVDVAEVDEPRRDASDIPRFSTR